MEEEIVTSLRLNRELWEKAKIHAIQKRITIRKLIEHLLEEELKKND